MRHLVGGGGKAACTPLTAHHQHIEGAVRLFTHIIKEEGSNKVTVDVQAQNGFLVHPFAALQMTADMISGLKFVWNLIQLYIQRISSSDNQYVFIKYIKLLLFAADANVTGPLYWLYTKFSLLSQVWPSRLKKTCEDLFSLVWKMNPNYVIRVSSALIWPFKFKGWLNTQSFGWSASFLKFTKCI